MDGLNFYLYVHCNPMSLVDPTGLMPPDGRSTDMMAMRNSPEAQSVTAAAWDQMSDSPVGTMGAGAYMGFAKSSYKVATGVVALVTDPVNTVIAMPAGFKNGITGGGAKILGAIFNNDGYGNSMTGLERASDFAEGVTDLAYVILPVKGGAARSSRAAAAATAGARPKPVESPSTPKSVEPSSAPKPSANSPAKKHLNSNDATSHFGLYEIEIFESLDKIGKTDLDRVTQSSGLPTRLHQQVRKLEKIYGKGNVQGRVVEDLGVTTTQTAKAAENARIRHVVDETGKVPSGNEKSFKP